MSEALGVHGIRRRYIDTAAELIKRLAGLAEVEMRAAVLGQRLGEMGPVQAVWTLETLIRGCLRKDDTCVLVYSGMLDPEVLGPHLEADHLDAMLQVGVDEGCVGAVQWLRSPGLEHDENEVPVDTDHLVERDLREMTLGERRSLARKARGDILDKLLQDPDPGVIKNLLNNPRTTEQTVLRIASRRPTVSSALEAVLRSPRWVRRYKIKLALLKNPHLRPRYSLALLVLLRPRDRKEIANDQTLPPMLRLAAQRLSDLERAAD